MLVQVTDGSPRSNKSSIFCGSGYVQPILSSGNEMFITFRSDHSIRKSGFLAVYTGMMILNHCCVIYFKFCSYQIKNWYRATIIDKE